MRVLLDTHYLLWLLNRPALVRPDILDTLADPRVAIFFSAASVWEIAIKRALGRTDFGVEPAAIIEGGREAGMVSLPVMAETAARVATLPRHHRDPFDRLLVVQAMADAARLLTADERLAPYSELVWVVPPAA